MTEVWYTATTVVETPRGRRFRGVVYAVLGKGSSMNTALAAKVRHLRSGDDIDLTIMQARLRRERRLRAVMAHTRTGYLGPTTWQKLDLVHEATRLINHLEAKRSAMEDAAAERYWTDVFAGYNA